MPVSLLAQRGRGSDDPQMTTNSEASPTSLSRALARRERHRERPLVVRGLTLVAAVVLVAGDVAVYLRFGFLPPLVLPVVVALLALEFHWAARLFAWGAERLRRYGRRLKALVRR
jgi:hypothetical protein